MTPKPVYIVLKKELLSLSETVPRAPNSIQCIYLALKHTHFLIAGVGSSGFLVQQEESESRPGCWSLILRLSQRETGGEPLGRLPEQRGAMAGKYNSNGVVRHKGMLMNTMNTNRDHLICV